MMDDISDEEASALLNAAQSVVALTTGLAKEIAPDHMMSASMTIIETAAASMIGAALLAQYGLQAEDEMEAALRVAKAHLRHFIECFVENGIRLIESGEMPPEFVRAPEAAP